MDSWRAVCGMVIIRSLPGGSAQELNPKRTVKSTAAGLNCGPGVAEARGAVNRDDLGLAVAQRVCPGGEALLEQIRVERVDDVVQRVVVGKPLLQGGSGAQRPAAVRHNRG